MNEETYDMIEHVIDNAFKGNLNFKFYEFLKENKIKKWVVEVKPKSQCKPPKVPKRKTRKYLNEVRTFAINEAKWMNAKEWCKDRNMEFIILTEVELMI